MAYTSTKMKVKGLTGNPPVIHATLGVRNGIPQ
jgi:hypothetical protein